MLPLLEGTPMLACLMHAWERRRVRVFRVFLNSRVHFVWMCTLFRGGASVAGLGASCVPVCVCLRVPVYVPWLRVSCGRSLLPNIVRYRTRSGCRLRLPSKYMYIHSRLRCCMRSVYLRKICSN